MTMKRRKEHLVQFRIAGFENSILKIGAKIKKTTVTGFLSLAIVNVAKTICVPNYLKILNCEEDETLGAFAERVWDVDEIQRFLNLAQTAPALLSTEEDIIWNAVKANPIFLVKPGQIRVQAVRLFWNALCELDDGETLSIEIITSTMKPKLECAEFEKFCTVINQFFNSETNV